VASPAIQARVAVVRLSTMMNPAHTGESDTAVRETAERVENPPRKPTPQNGPGWNRPMAKQATRFTAEVTVSASASGVVGLTQISTR